MICHCDSVKQRVCLDPRSPHASPYRRECLLCAPFFFFSLFFRQISLSRNETGPPCFVLFLCGDTEKPHDFLASKKISNLIHSRSHPTSAARPLHRRPSDQPVVFFCARFFFFFYLKFSRNGSERGKGDGRVCHHSPVGTMQPAACSSSGYKASCWLSPTVCGGMSHEPLTQDIYLGGFPPSKYKSSLAQRLFVPSVDGERGKKTQWRICRRVRVHVVGTPLETGDTSAHPSHLLQR